MWQSSFLKAQEFRQARESAAPRTCISQSVSATIYIFQCIDLYFSAVKWCLSALQCIEFYKVLSPITSYILSTKASNSPPPLPSPSPPEPPPTGWLAPSFDDQAAGNKNSSITPRVNILVSSDGIIQGWSRERRRWIPNKEITVCRDGSDWLWLITKNMMRANQ